MSTMHSKYHYSITCHTDDRAVMYCLRSLAHYSEHASQKNIGWGGTNDKVWAKSNHKIILRFTDPKYREVFRLKANELLAGRWVEVGMDDNDPATPKRKKRGQTPL